MRLHWSLEFSPVDVFTFSQRRRDDNKNRIIAFEGGGGLGGREENRPKTLFFFFFFRGKFLDNKILNSKMLLSRNSVVIAQAPIFSRFSA